LWSRNQHVQNNEYLINNQSQNNIKIKELLNNNINNKQVNVIMENINNDNKKILNNIQLKEGIHIHQENIYNCLSIKW